VDGAVARHLEGCVKAAREIAIIAPELRSPSTVAAFRKFQERYATARLYSYALLNQENRRAAWTSCYGSAALPAIRWERARVIVALESDFLGTEGSLRRSSTDST
jgi:molybdopterin-containing oxidoreductase family iron-sulfur binding subunit